MKIFKYIVKYKIIVILLYFIILPFCFYSWKNTKVNNSLTSYLPDYLSSVKAQKILEEYFNASSSAFIYIEGFENLSIVNEIVLKISKVDGVKDVFSTNSFGVLTIPPDFLPQNIKSQFYSENGTLITIQFYYGPEDKRTFKSVNEINKIIEKYKNIYFSGFAVINEESNREVRSNTQDIALYFTILAIFIFLTFNTGSFIEAFLFLFSLAIAYIINMGTNFFFEKISYLSSGLTGALQLGVSIDYSIFLFHRFEEEYSKDFKNNLNNSMIKALTYTYKSILTSSLTTLIGFLAITIMSIKIGFDLGIILAKGIFFTFLTTLTLLPSLILIFFPLIQKTKIKKDFIKNVFKKICSIKMLFKIKNKVDLNKIKLNVKETLLYKILRNKIFILFFIILFSIIFILSLLGYLNAPISYQINDTYPTNLKAIKDSIYIMEKTNSADIVSLIVEIDKFDDIENYQYNLLISDLKEIEGISSILHINFGRSFLEPLSFLPKTTLNSFYKDKYLVCHLKLKYPAGTENSYKIIEEIYKITKDYYKNFYLAGQGILVYDFARLTKIDFNRINTISLVLIFITLLISFFSISLPIMLIIIIELAIFINFSISFLSNTPISFIAQTILGSIQLGATIDYGVLYLNRLFEEFKFGKPKIEAIVETSKSTLLPIFSASICLFIAVSVYSLFSNFPIVKNITSLIGRGALISFLTVVIFAPFLCYIFYSRIKFTLEFKKKLFKID